QIERLQLLDPAHQKCKLRLKRRPTLAFVKRVQKRIRIRLHHALRIQAFSQNARQRALSHSDGSFHSNVAWQFEKIGHDFVRRFRNLQDILDTSQWQLREELTAVISDFRFARIPAKSEIRNPPSFRIAACLVTSRARPRLQPSLPRDTSRWRPGDSGTVARSLA